nr:unnamed protein product [Callosobruchus chinensis]
MIVDDNTKIVRASKTVNSIKFNPDLTHMDCYVCYMCETVVPSKEELLRRVQHAYPQSNREVLLSLNDSIRRRNDLVTHTG